ncbi:hypothetical protein AAFF_G00323510 [Aldrovandia affinis]|uniref:C-type lectin domain-containing protein n=1 Tax=Aldrovandia affinis TaxID=143900 RepID=A0AAD7R9A1_9TELE|nr:hypothetical protein AAFF_G00323510 [Aldrovandia affinis]
METDNIYANVNTIKGKELNTDDIQQQSSETSNSGMRSADRRFVFQRWAAVGLFSVLLLTVIIALCVHYNTVIGNLEEKHSSHGSILKTNYTRTWKWVDDRTLNTGFWRTGEPNNANLGENCANSESNDSPKCGWNDLPCIHKKSWICEMPVKQ